MVRTQRAATGETLTSPHRAADLLRRLLGDEVTEVSALVLLSTRRGVVAHHEAGPGTTETVLVTPRELFKAVLLANPAVVILCPFHFSWQLAASRVTGAAQPLTLSLRWPGAKSLASNRLR